MALAAIDLGAGLTRAWTDFLSFLPRLVGFLVILAVGLIVSKLVSKAVTTLCHKAGLDRHAQRPGLRETLSRTSTSVSAMLGKVVYYVLVLITLDLAFQAFGPNPISTGISGIVAFLPRVLVALAIMIVAVLAGAALKNLLTAMLGKLSYGSTVAKVCNGVVLAVGAFAALDQLQIAPAIVDGLYYGIIAALVGVTIVAVGGSGIQPLRSRWESALDKASSEASNIRSMAVYPTEESQQSQQYSYAGAEQSGQYQGTQPLYTGQSVQQQGYQQPIQYPASGQTQPYAGQQYQQPYQGQYSPGQTGQPMQYPEGQGPSNPQ